MEPILTRCYPDFRDFISKLFGGQFVMFFGDRKNPQTQFEAWATNGNGWVVFYSLSGKPESFDQEFMGPMSMHVSDMDGFRVVGVN